MHAAMHGTLDITYDVFVQDLYCLPRPCFGAEADQMAIWYSRDLVTQPVFHWRLLEVLNEDVIGNVQGAVHRSVHLPSTGIAVCIEWPAHRIDGNTLESQLQRHVLPTGESSSQIHPLRKD
jgi:hypothetical protein